MVDQKTDKLYQNIDEIASPIQANISGVVPDWLSGTLLRNGPGKFEIGETSYSHAFDGLALLQQFVFKDGTVTYFNKYLRSQTYLVNMKAGRIIEGELGTPACPDPSKNIFARFRSHLFPKEYTDNASVNFCSIKNKIYALTEVPVMTEINSDNLETLNRVRLADVFQESLKQLFHVTPHPLQDKHGDIYNLCTGIDKHLGLAYIITKIPSGDHHEEGIPLHGSSVVAVLPSNRRQSYSHSFGMTEKYFIFIQQPLTVNLWKVAAARFFKWSILDTFSWDPTQPTIFNVISRQSGQIVAQFTTEAFFFLHVVNAYDVDDDVIIDISCYKDSEILNMLYLNKSQFEVNHNRHEISKQAQLRRYILPVGKNQQNGGSSCQPVPLKSNNVESEFEILTENSIDLPKINDKYHMLPYRYLYGVSGIVGLSYEYLVKVDMKEKTTKMWNENGCLVSEPVFVPNPNDEETEDGGIVLSSVYNTNSRISFVLILDARSFIEIARAEVPLRFAMTFHGIFIPSS